uniref:Uncharacterized protein n=1 Tax=Arundo donax TaxID=35708 RepID=A0A0A9CHZ3_ARUDO
MTITPPYVCYCSMPIIILPLVQLFSSTVTNPMVIVVVPAFDLFFSSE